MHDDVLNAQLAAHFGRVVAAVVVAKNDLVHQVERYLAVGFFQCFGGVVGRQNNNDLFSFVHVRLVVLSFEF